MYGKGFLLRIEELFILEITSCEKSATSFGKDCDFARKYIRVGTSRFFRPWKFIKTFFKNVKGFCLKSLDVFLQTSKDANLQYFVNKNVFYYDATIIERNPMSEDKGT